MPLVLLVAASYERKDSISFFEAIFLGILQGLTEFLPVSSSGHLVLMQHLFGMTKPDLFFDTMVHLGTLVSVLIVFKKDLGEILVTTIDFGRRRPTIDQLRQSFSRNTPLRLVFLIAITLIPTGVIGFFFRDWFEALFASLLLDGLTLILTGIFLHLTRWLPEPRKTLENMTALDAGLIGLAQTVAIIPGISRSGATISSALGLGINRELAGRFSFLMSIPAILGAIVLEFQCPEAWFDQHFFRVLAATITAAIVGYIALRVLLRFVVRGKLHVFAPYCYAVGVLAIVLGW